MRAMKAKSAGGSTIGMEMSMMAGIGVPKRAVGMQGVVMERTVAVTDGTELVFRDGTNHFVTSAGTRVLVTMAGMEVVEMVAVMEPAASRERQSLDAHREAMILLRRAVKEAAASKKHPSLHVHQEAIALLKLVLWKIRTHQHRWFAQKAAGSTSMTKSSFGCLEAEVVVCCHSALGCMFWC